MKRTKKKQPEKQVESTQKLNLDKPDLEKGMTNKQKHFCHEYVRDWNGTRSAKAAGYSERSAGEMANALLKNHKIQNYIKAIQEDIAKEIGISKLQLVEELKSMALSSISGLYSNWMTPNDFETLKEQNPGIMKAIQEVSTKTETKMNENKDLIQVNYVKIKFHSKQAAIDSILKAMGWNEPDNINIFIEQPLFGDLNNDE